MVKEEELYTEDLICVSVGSDVGPQKLNSTKSTFKLEEDFLKA